jgi:hypothetical protein
MFGLRRTAIRVTITANRTGSCCAENHELLRLGAHGPNAEKVESNLVKRNA